MSMILREIGLDDRHLVDGIDVDPVQADYSGGSVDDIFDRLRASPANQMPFVFASGDSITGFIVLREGAALPDWAETGTISLHNFRLDRRIQGRGIGKTALRLVGEWIAGARPGVSHVFASVNVVNLAALRLSLGTGLTTTGAMVEGRLGPEIVMRAAVERLGQSTRSL